MSRKEARRPGLVQAAIAGKVTNAEAARALGVSVRQFRRIKTAYRTAGLDGLLHGNRGRRPHNRLDEGSRERIVALIQGPLAGLNDSHLTEKLCETEDFKVSREMVRRLRQGAGIAPVRRRRAPKHRSRRRRSARAGALVLIDGSDHLWFGAEAPRATLLGAIDDATGAILALHFRPSEDLHGYVVLLGDLIRTHGLPGTLYGDRLSVFVRNDKHWTLEEELAGQQDATQFGQILLELTIGFIAAGSPQAKGRIERLWATLQDRLVAELRLRGITTLEAANDFLSEFIADYNRRFAVAPRETTNSWRRAPRELDRILACRYIRTVARDNTVTVPGRWIQLPPHHGGRSWHGRKVEVREQLDGRLIVFCGDKAVVETAWTEGPFTLMPRQHIARRQKLGMNLGRLRGTGDRPSTQSKPRARKPGIGHYTNVRRPGKKHPWNHPEKRNSSPQKAGTGRT